MFIDHEAALSCHIILEKSELPFSCVQMECRLCVTCLDYSYFLPLCDQQENTYLWRTSLYLAASASAEFFADIALAPMEAAKVRIQTQPGYANTLRECAPKMYAEEGLWA